ncbi:MAG: ankyrin repeat domain-containing protein [Pseudomonadota bacterium]
MDRTEYLRLMPFPKEWETWEMIPEEWLSGAMQSYEPGMEIASEHDRHGAFQWWLKTGPSEDQLLKLAQLANLDPDLPMAQSVRDSIAFSFCNRFSDLLKYDSDDVTSPIDLLDWRSPEGDTTLHYAAMRGDEMAVRILVELGIDVNARGDMGRTPLHYALTFGHRSAAKSLVSYGADETTIDEFGNVPG